MTAQINLEDMRWMAVSPELVVIFTAFLVLLLGLKKSFDNSKSLSRLSTTGPVPAGQPFSR